jgi:prenyltransferase beta subunit
MLQVARLAPKLLGDSTPLVADFLRGQHQPGGGFSDRQGNSDLYYTTFGIAGWMALQIPLPKAELVEYLETFGAGEGLPLVELSCLARCWAGLQSGLPSPDWSECIWREIETYRATDGGYQATPGAAHGTLYGCFLALGAAQDLGRSHPDAQRMLQCIDALRCADGGYSNTREMPMGLTPSTAAAVALLRHLGRRPPESLADWFMERLHPAGGFLAGEGAAMPDLLSTATALHALSSLHADIDPIREACLDFIDTLWTARGGFYGTWEDDGLDCEYTYYGLLSLGHLSL